MRVVFLFAALVFTMQSGNVYSQGKRTSGKTREKIIKKIPDDKKNVSNEPKFETTDIVKEINDLRKDYKTFRKAIRFNSDFTTYMIKRTRRNEEVALRSKLSKDTKSAKVQDMIERAKLLKMLETRLSEFEKLKDPMWTPELLWRTAVIYHEIAEELFLRSEKEDEKTGKILEFDEDYRDTLEAAHKLSNGVVRVADSTLGVDFYRKKSEQNLRKLISGYPKFRALGSAFHLLARIYENPPFSTQDPNQELPAKVSLAAVCSNWGYNPFKDDFNETLVSRGKLILASDSLTAYKGWAIKEFPGKIPFDLFQKCKPVKGGLEFIGTAWATLGKYLSTKRIKFEKVDATMTDEQSMNIHLFNYAITKWSALSAYKRALGPEYKNLSTRGYIVYFAGLMLYQNELNPALAMKLFDQVIVMGQNKDLNSPHKEAIKYIGFLFQDEKVDNIDDQKKYSWVDPFPVQCKNKCPVKKLVTFYKGRENEPHVKRIWYGIADFFKGIEEGKAYQRSEEDYLFAWNLYDYIFRKMDTEGNWKYNPDKPAVFWKMKELIDIMVAKNKNLLLELKTERDKNEVRKKISEWEKKRKDLYQFALNTVFNTDETDRFLTSHQKFLTFNAAKKVKIPTVTIDELRMNITYIKSFALMYTGITLASKAKDLFDRFKKATGAEKEILRRKADNAFNEAVKYFKGIIKDYPNSIYQYGAMVQIMNFYNDLMDKSAEYYIIDLAPNEAERKKRIYSGLDWGRKVRDSHLGSDWRKNAAVILNNIYMDKLAYKDPPYPFDPKKDDAKGKITYVKKEIPESYQNYIKDAQIYMKLYPEDSNSPLFLYKIARIFLHYQDVDLARKTYDQILEKYCSHETAYYASYDLFLTYRHQKTDALTDEKFKKERDSVISGLEKKKCGGGEKHRELMSMIAKLELSELVKTTEKVFAEANSSKDKGKNDPDKWKSALTYYLTLKKKVESRKPPKKEEKEYYSNLFGIYWNIYTCKKELGDFIGAIEILESIRKQEKIFEVADREGYKEIVFYQLADAYTKSFNEDRALKMWDELARKGVWRLRDGKRVKTAQESNFRLISEEKKLDIYRSNGDKFFRETVSLMEKLMEEYSRVKRMYAKKFSVGDANPFKDLAAQMGLKQDKLDKYYIVYWNCPGGKCTSATVTDKFIYYKEMLYQVYLNKALGKDGSEKDLSNVLQKLTDLETALDYYVKLSRIFKESGTGDSLKITTSKQYEAMWKKRLFLTYQRASIYKYLMTKSGSATNREKAREKFTELLKKYKKLYDKGVRATPSLNPGYAVVNYGEALIQYVTEEYKKVDNPFKGTSTPEIDAFEDSQLQFKILQTKLSGKGEKLNKKLEDLKKKLADTQNAYVKEIQEFAVALQNLAPAARAKLSQKDLLKHYKVYQKFTKKYPKFWPLAQKVGFQPAIQQFLADRKDIKKLVKDMENLGKDWSKSVPEMVKKFFKDFVPKSKNGIKNIEKIYKDQNLPIIATLKKTIKDIDKLYKTKKDLQVNDCVPIIQVLGQMATLSTMLAGADAVVLTLVRGGSLDGLAKGYSWYTEQKGYIRSQVALIKANLMALKLKMIIQGIDIFAKAPFLKKLSQAELEEDRAAKLKESNCAGKPAKIADQCYLDYKRKMFYKRSYSIPKGKTTESVEMVPQDRLIDEYNKTFKEFHSIVTSEKISSNLIEEAFEDYRQFEGSKKYQRVFKPKMVKMSH
ncbi:MAG: tetratricopeptide repeat protein [Deltaproteobacteria bacterium]|nr:tetratricopeptide repeat protein [Deltaproteobacteria bacterium]